MQPTIPPPGQFVRNQSISPASRGLSRTRLFGAAMIVIGIVSWWYNAHLAATEGKFWIKLCLLAPAGAFGGMLMVVRPDWAGKIRSDSSAGQKNAFVVLFAAIAIVSGINFYVLSHSPGGVSSTVTPWSPAMGTPVLSASAASAPSIQFLSRSYHLSSFNNRPNAMWEFVTGTERIDAWTTLLTIIDRTDAKTRSDLDRLAEGVMAQYKSGGAQILTAKTLQGRDGSAFNYMVAAFDESGHQRFELDFVKCGMTPRNAVIAIYGVRISDPQDYKTKAKQFLDRSSSEVGRALGELVLPDTEKLPRRIF